MVPLPDSRWPGRGRGCGRPRSRRSRSACCSASCTRRTSAGRPRRSGRRCPSSRCRCRVRCCRSSASTSASRPPSPTPTSRPGSPPTCASSPVGPEAPACPRPLVMQSSGGVADIDLAAGRSRPGVVLSGPAGGVVGRVATSRRRSGFPTCSPSTWAARAPMLRRSSAAACRRRPSRCVAGVPIKLPAVDVHTVSAGGGSIAWADEGGALRVGPRSAGAGRARGLRARRRRADRHRRRPGARLPARRRELGGRGGAAADLARQARCGGWATSSA